jgi:hypothetical protein
MALQLELGLDVIRSYKRLAYTPWHALAEFIDNSTQSYFNHRADLDEAFKVEKEQLTVRVIYEKDEPGGLIRIADNAMGMSYEELTRALHVGLRPEITSGRSQFGMGMKTAACWLGNYWTIRTKRRGETVEHRVKVDVEAIAGGKSSLPYEKVEGKPKDAHYTVIEITELNRPFHGRTLGKIRDFLQSMYRQDLLGNSLVLEWQHERLGWMDIDAKLLVAKSGEKYKKDFNFNVDGKKVNGWVGILSRGSRAEAGFSILHGSRVIKGWPDSWRPQSLYGQIQGSNDLINQRLIGEVNLDDFEVSHTKDDILWMGEEEELVEEGLKKYCGDYANVAKTHRKASDERGPSETETATAVDEFKRELESPEMVDRISLEDVPPPDVVETSLKGIVSAVGRRAERFKASIGHVLEIRGYLEHLSANDPYVVDDAPTEDELLVIINTAHPHWSQLKGSEGVLNYLRHCTYDAVAEWQARKKTANLDPNTIKLLKDQLLRVPMLMEMHSGAGASDLGSVA